MFKLHRGLYQPEDYALKYAMEVVLLLLKLKQMHNEGQGGNSGDCLHPVSEVKTLKIKI